jgi:undecaprenyl diphosphate synthase
VSVNTSIFPKDAAEVASDERLLPRHVAIIMDGNGRWATRRRAPRFAGHRAGVNAVREVVSICAEKGIDVLTLFAFSSENWQRPAEEVGLLMNLFMSALQQEMRKLHENNIRLSVIGDRSAFSRELRKLIGEAELLMRGNTGLELVIAANYGGRWDLTEATRAIAQRVADGELDPADIDEDMLSRYVCSGSLPEPDLFIRTGGEKRISNFLLWHLAYTELVFTDALWPDFDRQALDSALASYASRQRRYGRTGEQIAAAKA